MEVAFGLIVGNILVDVRERALERVVQFFDFLQRLLNEVGPVVDLSAQICVRGELLA